MSHSDFILDDPHLLLQESDWLHRLARGLCSDRDLAADLSQEALLAAWESRGRVRGPLRPWLAGVVRKLVANRRRAQARRAKRESEACIPENAPATDEVVVRAGLHHGVVREVMSLDEPYRTAILLRYFDDLSCHEIAKRQSVPVETIRTRIKRGVALLRVRLDQEHGGRQAWVGPLAAMSTTGAKAGASSVALVVLFMMQLKFVVPLFVAVVLGSLFMLAQDPAVPEASEGGGGIGVGTPAQAKEQSADTSDSSPSSEAASRDTLAEKADQAFAVTGRLLRIVDDAPAVGVEVLLVPPDELWTEGRSLEIDTDAVTPGTVRNSALPTFGASETDAEGRFRIECEAPDTFRLLTRSESYVSLISDQQIVGSQTQVDLGTAHLRVAVELAGRVRDTKDKPVSGLEFYVIHEDIENGNSWLSRARSTRVVTDEDGRFHVASRAPTGAYRISIHDQQVRLAQESLARRRITEEDHFLELVVDRDLGRIEGVVVDAEDRPVPRIRVNSVDGYCYAQTDEKGRFELRRRRGASARVALRVWRERFRRCEAIHDTKEHYEWGTKGVKVSLPKGVDVTLQVVQAPEMQPIETFEIDMQRVGAPVWGRGGVARGSGADTRYPSGKMELPGMVPGKYRALVVQRNLSTVVPLEIFPSREGIYRLVVPAIRRVTVKLVGSAGQPVLGSRCELLSVPEEPRDYSVLTMQPSRKPKERGGTRGLPYASQYARVAGDVSNASGEVVFDVPTEGSFMLRVFGESHAPLLRAFEDLGSGNRIEVTLGEGASLKGKIVPASLVRSVMTPTLCLRSLDGSGAVYPRRFPSLRSGKRIVQSDGTFEVAGIPPGDWEVFFSYSVSGRRSSGVYQLLPVARVNALESGEVRVLELDCTSAAPVPISGHAMLNGKPAPFARLDLEGDRQLGQPLYAVFDCDARGRFEGKITPGKYRVEAKVLDLTSGESVSCSHPGTVVVVAGEPAVVTLDLHAKR